MLFLGGNALGAAGLEAADRIANATGARVLAHTFPARMEAGAGVPATDRLPYRAEQAAEVRKVKRSESGMITDPVKLQETATVGDALKLMAEHKIGGIPVVNGAGRLVGIVTNRELRFERQLAKPIAEVMTKDNLVTAKQEVSLARSSWL